MGERDFKKKNQDLVLRETRLEIVKRLERETDEGEGNRNLRIKGNRNLRERSMKERKTVTLDYPFEPYD